MAIKIDKIVKPDGLSFQNVWIEVTVGDDKCKYLYSAPSNLSGDELQSYLDSKEDYLKRDILRNMYGGSDAYDKSLKDFESWVSDGCKNAEVKGTDADGEEITVKDEEVIEKKAWVDVEPSVDTASLIAELQAKVTALENA